MRKEISNDFDLDAISGGNSLNFYKRDGNNFVYIEGVGTYNCGDSASEWIASQISKNTNTQDLIDQAIREGIFYK